MSKCAICHGSGCVPCAECDGVGYTLHEVAADSDELVHRLCGACHGKPLLICRTCTGSGVVGKAPALVGVPELTAAGTGRPGTPGHALPDRLAGRWKDEDGLWYEFAPDGDHHYRTTAGGPMGVSATGTATLTGHSVKVDASDKLLGRYSLELVMRGTHLEGIDRKAGFPIPLDLVRV